MKYLGASIDVETTGLEDGIHEIVQISIITHDGNFNQQEKFKSFIMPQNPGWADDEAFKRNQLSLTKLKEAPAPAQIRNLIIEWHENVLGGKKMMPLGHNYGFDKSFLKLYFGKTYDDLFHYHSRDTMILAEALRDVGLIPKDMSTSLVSLCEHFGVPHVPHDADGDAAAVLILYREMLKLIRR